MHSSAGSTASRESVLSPSAQALDKQSDVFISIEGLLSKLDGRHMKDTGVSLHALSAPARQS